MSVDPISEDEVFERLKADLATKGLALHRGTLDGMDGMAGDERGRFFITKVGSEEFEEDDVELDRRARHEGVPKPNEALVPSHGEGI